MTVTALSAHAAVAAYAQRENLRAHDGALFWLESEPATGNTSLMQWQSDRVQRVTPGGFSVQSQVNGYGGGAFCVLGGHVYLVNAADRQIYALNLQDRRIEPLTTQPDTRFGGLTADPRRGRILAVCEHLDNGFGVGQTLVSVDTQDGDSRQLAGEARGRVNLGCPTVSANGSSIAWVEWTLPAMPWEHTRLKRAVLTPNGGVTTTSDCSPEILASVQQPQFSGDLLCALSDHLGWWQPYRVEDDGSWTAQCAEHADHANAPWQLDERHYGGLGGDRWVRVLYRQGIASLVVVDGQGLVLKRLADGFTDFRSVQVMDHRIYAVGRCTDTLDSILEIEPDLGVVRILVGGEQTSACHYMVAPEPFNFDARDGLQVQGFLYRPAEIGSELPPVIMRVHGGPTSAAYPVFDPQIAFWVSHGFAVADTNYRGSTGYGRAFRMALQGEWGVADSEDIGDAVTELAREHSVDGSRAFIMGRSAGGFTVLNALINTDVFLAGASLFGVSDPESLRHMTHRFESGYLDWLLGDPEENHAVWQQRTPLFRADRIQCPVIFFQGEQDKVVVPEQTESMADVLRRCGVPVEVVRFAEEGHGFRRSENQAAVLSSLLRFFRWQLP